MKMSGLSNVLVVIVFVLFGLVYAQFTMQARATVKNVEVFKERLKGAEERADVMNAKLDILFKEVQAMKKSMGQHVVSNSNQPQEKPVPRTVL